MEQDLPTRRREDIRLDPEARICPEFDRYSIRLTGLPSRFMGVRVIDNCAQEHQT